MSDMLNALIAAGALPQTSYGTSSRYYGVPVIEFATRDGQTLRYVRGASFRRRRASRR